MSNDFHELERERVLSAPIEIKLRSASRLEFKMMEDLLEELDSKQIVESKSFLAQRKHLSKWIDFFISFARVDLYRNYQYYPRKNPIKGVDLNSRDKKIKVKKWPNNVRLLFFFYLIKFSISTTLQYMYDFHQVELETLAELLNKTLDIDHNITANNSSFIESKMNQLDQRINSERYLMRLLGAPYMHVRFLIECGYIYMILFNVAFYLQPQIYQHFMEPFNFSLIRMISNRKKEQFNINTLIVNELKIFISSHWNYIRCKIARQSTSCRSANLIKLLIAEQHISFTGTNNHSKLFIDNYNRLNQVSDVSLSISTQDQIVYFGITQDRLRQFALKGKFQPMNRRAKWQEEYITILFLAFIYAWFIPSIMILLTTQLYLPHSSIYGNSYIESAPMDVLCRFEIIIFSLIGGTAGSFYISASFMTAIDQIYYINKLNQKIKHCIRLNHRLIYYLRKISNEDKKLTADGFSNEIRSDLLSPDGVFLLKTKINTELLYILLHYKILIKQLKPLKKSIGFLILTFTQPTLLAPILAFIHAPLIQKGLLGVFVLSLPAITIMVDICYGPSCFMHSCGLSLYRSLSTLVATLAELREFRFEDSNQRLDLLDDHLVWSLRRELSSPDETMDQFAIGIFGVRSTYSNLMAAHFWTGVLTLFAFLSNSSR